MDRRDFLKKVSIGSVVFTGPLFLSCQKASKLDQPNIVWIMAEDICPDLSCYGTPAVITPSIDKLATEGIKYTNVFATAPVCSPARSAMITGMYQTSIGAHQHRSHRHDDYILPTPIRPITDYLREHGYFTALGCGYSAKTDFNFNTEKPVFDGSDWKERTPEQHFFAQITLPVTHRKFRRDKIRPVNPESVEIPPYYPDHPLTRRDWADYLESIQIMDRQVGQIIKRLAEEGLEKDTVVIFSGDNGRCHVRGKQWLYEGGIHVPLIIRWPEELNKGRVINELISTIDISATILDIAGIETPKHIQGRSFIGNHTEREFVVSARDRCDETVDRIRCVRTKKFKYIRNFNPDRPYLQDNVYKSKQYPILTLIKALHDKGKLTPDQNNFMAEKRSSEELYDLENDPHELHNLADNPVYSENLVELRQKLEDWIIETGDQGSENENEDVLKFWQEESKKRNIEYHKKRGLPLNISDEDYLKWWEKQLLTE